MVVVFSFKNETSALSLDTVPVPNLLAPQVETVLLTLFWPQAYTICPLVRDRELFAPVPSLFLAIVNGLESFRACLSTVLTNLFNLEVSFLPLRYSFRVE